MHLPKQLSPASRIHLIAALAVLGVPSVTFAQAMQGITFFEQRCVSCHGAPAADSRAPTRESLGQRTPEAILEAITTGSMRAHAEGLTDAQKRVLAEQLTGHPLGAAQAAP